MGKSELVSGKDIQVKSAKDNQSGIGLSETVLASAFEYSAIGMSLVSLEGNWIKINSKLSAITGYTEAALLSTALKAIIHPEDRKNSEACYKKLLSRKIDAFQIEERIMHKNGTAVWVNQNVSLIKNATGKPLFFLSLTEDINHKKNIELALAEAEAKFRILVEQSLAGVYIIQDAVFKYINPVLAETVGYSESELLGADFLQLLIVAEDHQTVIENLNSRLKGDVESVQYVIRAKKRNGELIWIEVLGNKIMYNGKPAIMGTLIDITLKKEMEKLTLQQKIRDQKKITRAVLNAQEKERNRIGQELHDNINQILAGTKLYLAVTARGNKKLQVQLKRPIELIENSIQEIRRLSSKHVTPLKNINLKELINSLMEDVHSSIKIKTVFIFKGAHVALDDGLKLNIYRIIQEQTSNVIKHAKAKHFSIRIHARPAKIHIAMEDDGKGFDVKKKRKGIGISNMIYRTESFNGNLVIESEPGIGCRIFADIPIEPLKP